MNKEIENIIKQIDQGKYSNTYVIQGDEEFYSDLIIDKLEKHVFKNSNSASYDYTKAHGKDFNIQKLLEYVTRFPMLEKYQLIVVKDAQHIGGISSSKERELLQCYIENPNPQTILVLIYRDKLVDRKTIFGKSLAKHANLITTKKLYSNQVEPWIKSYAKYIDIKITDKATGMIYEYLGNDLKRISNELLKINSSLGSQHILDDHIISEYLGISREYNIFELQTAIATRDLRKILSILKYFENNPKACPVIPLISILYTFFTKIIQIHMSKNKSSQYLTKALNINAWFLHQYLAATKKYSLKKALNVIEILHFIDLKSKGIDNPSIHDSQLIKELISSILHPLKKN